MYQEDLHPNVDLLAQRFRAHSRDLSFRDRRHAHRLDQVVDGSGGHTLDTGFLDHGEERPFSRPSWAGEGREINAFSQLGDLQIDGASTRLPVTVAAAIPVIDPVSAELTEASATP